ncbi:MAG: DUF3429 domain-containing protein [Lysobacterales bacterium]
MAAPGAFLSRRIPPAAAWLGGAGVIPFVAIATLAVVASDASLRELALRAFVAYSAVILSFLGGVRWGAALGEVQWRALALSVAPSLLAFLCLLIPAEHAVKVLALLYAVVGLFDVLRRPSPEWPAWFMKLRARLSGAVVVVHVALLAALIGVS